MAVEALRDFLLWNTVLNSGVLLLWFGVFYWSHDWLYRLHSRWFRMPVEQFDACHYAGMAVYKIGIFLFGLGPYVALLIAA
jgi:hypothetical protein